MIRSQEVELKLELLPADVSSLLALPWLGAPAGAPADLETVYFDTPDGALRKAGYSLRVRRSSGECVQTVKYKAADAGGFSDRPEWEAQVEDLRPDLAAASSTPLRKLLARKKLREGLAAVSETRVRRTSWQLRRGGSEIELVLDEGEVASADRRQALCEIELELKRGDVGDLFDLAKEIGRNVPLRMGVMTKSERGHFLLQKRKSRVKKAERVVLDSDMSVAEAFGVIVQACLRHFRLNEPLVDRRNAAALHQVRVATRRLRSALGLFRSVVADDEYLRLRDELRWFAGQLGDARDLDVLLEAGDREDSSEQEEAARRRALRKARKHAYERVHDALSSDRLPRLILDLVAWAETGEWRRSDAAQRPVPAFAGERLERRWRRVRKDGRHILGLDPEARHQLRIDVKKLRYTAEFFWSFAPKRARRHQKTFIDRLAELQESLGHLNDIETGRTLAPDKPADEAEIGRLLARAQKAHAALREQGPYWRFPDGRPGRLRP